MSTQPHTATPIDHEGLADRAAARLEPLLVNLERRSSGLEPRVREQLRALREAYDRLGDDSDERRRLSVQAWALCFQNDLVDPLALSGLPLIYNFRASFDENAALPWDRMPDGSGETEGRRWSLLGLPIGYPIGIPASVLTANSAYIDYYARQGFNVLTYKTVRSRRWNAHPAPNWVYVEGVDRPLDPAEGIPVGSFIGERDTFFTDPNAFSMANSFGVPSEAPEVWERDVAKALTKLGAGKLLIVSVMGSNEIDELRDPASLADDFAQLAVRASRAGAPAVELNLSCPNTLDPTDGSSKPPICRDPSLTEEIVRRVAEELRGTGTRLVAKLSYLAGEQLELTLERLAGYIDAVSGINTIPVEVVDRAGGPTFGQRKVGGLSGVAIRDFALDFVRNVTALREVRDWRFELIGMGGVMSADDVRALLGEGADAVQTATAAAHDPTIPARLTREPKASLSIEAASLIEALEERPGADVATMAALSGLSLAVARAALNELETLGVARVVREPSPTGLDGYSLDEKQLERQLA